MRITSKFGVFDDALTLDFGSQPWMGALLENLKKTVGADDFSTDTRAH